MRPPPAPVYDPSMSLESIRRAVRTAEARAMEHQQSLADLEEKMIRRLDRQGSLRIMSDKRIERLIRIAIGLTSISLVAQIYGFLRDLGAITRVF